MTSSDSSAATDGGHFFTTQQTTRPSAKGQCVGITWFLVPGLVLLGAAVAVAVRAKRARRARSKMTAEESERVLQRLCQWFCPATVAVAKAPPPRPPAGPVD